MIKNAMIIKISVFANEDFTQNEKKCYFTTKICVDHVNT